MNDHGLKADLKAAIKLTMKDWKKAKKREDRVHDSQLHRMRQARPMRFTIRDAAFEVMEDAYKKASSNGRYYANARQIMYAARPLILDRTGGNCWKDSTYFTQTLLKDYLELYSPGWKVVWDARGHMHEPHTGHSISLGDIDVMKYRKEWDAGGLFDTTPLAAISVGIETKGPDLRFGTALFIEKEGFGEILKDAGIAERYDLAIFSSKGLPVGAACDLARAFHSRGVKVLVTRDFDLAGFKVVRTLRLGTRLRLGAPVIDIGLRLVDVDGLESEPVDYRQGKDPQGYLRQCGATREECDFLVEGGGWRGWHGRRVELNAMTSEQFIDWLGSKLDEHRVEKVVPDVDVLGRAYQRAVFRLKLEEAAKKFIADLPEVNVPVPEDLDNRVRDKLTDNPETSWDEAVAGIVEDMAL